MERIRNDRSSYRTRANLVIERRGPANLDQHLQDYRAYLIETSEVDFFDYIDMRFCR